jgi:uncharacterized oligopeptide transporter (OPT) family protein
MWRQYLQVGETSSFSAPANYVSVNPVVFLHFNLCAAKKENIIVKTTASPVTTT